MIRRIHARTVVEHSIQEGDLVLSPKDQVEILKRLNYIYPPEYIEHKLHDSAWVDQHPISARDYEMHRHVVRWFTEPDDWIHPSQFTPGIGMDGRIDPR